MIAGSGACKKLAPIWDMFILSFPSQFTLTIVLLSLLYVCVCAFSVFNSFLFYFARFLFDLKNGVHFGRLFVPFWKWNNGKFFFDILLDWWKQAINQLLLYPTHPHTNPHTNPPSRRESVLDHVYVKDYFILSDLTHSWPIFGDHAAVIVLFWS